MKAKYLFISTAVTEFLTGLALIAFPSLTANLLLGLPLLEASGITVGRVAGAALISLAIACWLAKNDEKSRAAKGLITAMLFYNISAFAILAKAGFTSKISILLLLALILHLVLSAWCIYALKNANTR